MEPKMNNIEEERDRYKLALEYIIRHMNMTQPGASAFSTVCHIAHKALEPDWDPSKPVRL